MYIGRKLCSVHAVNVALTFFLFGPTEIADNLFTPITYNTTSPLTFFLFGPTDSWKSTSWYASPPWLTKYLPCMVYLGRIKGVYGVYGVFRGVLGCIYGVYYMYKGVYIGVCTAIKVYKGV